MFPLAHHFLVKQILKNPRYHLAERLTPLQKNLIRLGAVIPDLVAGMGMDRNFGHLMGKSLYDYCRENHPAAEPFALGVWLHGADPCGFDYYADEHWQKGNGWCFQQCTPYIDAVIDACALPPEWGLWKAHNFVEMAAEMACFAQDPTLGRELLAAGQEAEAVQTVADILVQFGNARTESVIPVLASMDQIFSIHQVTPLDLAEKYALQLKRRHDIQDADPVKIAAVLTQVKEDLTDEFWRWYPLVETMILREIEQYPTCLTTTAPR